MKARRSKLEARPWTFRAFLREVLLSAIGVALALLILSALAALARAARHPSGGQEEKPCFARGADGYWRRVSCSDAAAQPRERVDALVPREAYELAAPSILKIEGPLGRRSGTAVCVHAADGNFFAVTAAHVLRAAGKFRVANERADIEGRDTGGSIRSDWQTRFVPHAEYDLALVVAPPCAPAELAGQKDGGLAPGDGVFIVGYPFADWSRHARWGRVGSRPAGRWVMTDLATDHGDSGSGLFNERGELVAVCQGKSSVGAPFIDAALVPAMIDEALALRKMGRF
jgi:S1-C subfamily serine protease